MFLHKDTLETVYALLEHHRLRGVAGEHPQEHPQDALETLLALDYQVEQVVGALPDAGFGVPDVAQHFGQSVLVAVHVLFGEHAVHDHLVQQRDALSRAGRVHVVAHDLHHQVQVLGLLLGGPPAQGLELRVERTAGQSLGEGREVGGEPVGVRTEEELLEMFDHFIIY